MHTTKRRVTSLVKKELFIVQPHSYWQSATTNLPPGFIWRFMIDPSASCHIASNVSQLLPLLIRTDFAPWFSVRTMGKQQYLTLN
jgi:hypothetical protein